MFRHSPAVLPGARPKGGLGWAPSSPGGGQAAMACSWWAAGGQLVGSWWAAAGQLVGSWWAAGAQPTCEGDLAGDAIPKFQDDPFTVPSGAPAAAPSERCVGARAGQRHRRAGSSQRARLGRAADGGQKRRCRPPPRLGCIQPAASAPPSRQVARRPACSMPGRPWHAPAARPAAPCCPPRSPAAAWRGTLQA
jgi:hypothetical protein